MKKELARQEDTVWREVKGKIDATHKSDLDKEEQFEKRVEKVLQEQRRSPTSHPKICKAE